jgi:hypothetical protein
VPGPPSAEALRALSRKYDVLAKLRRDRAEGGAIADRHVLRALAREFPGALRELDTLTDDEIDRRASALSLAAEGDVVAPWMAWMAGYHATMRAALLIKARTARLRELEAETARAVALSASERTGISVDEGFVRVVFQRLAEEFEMPADEIWQALFPTRRPARY